ncbi:MULTISPECIES: ABC transporter permease [Clostridia]|jgi:putative ABC transport system permease protein|uniref:ABC transporter permease n=10 Tax=root TaxID=1 RepID=A0A415LHH2_9FIRM|nr:MULTISPECIES: ABC transporter permease [Clostridia]RHC41974.1 ABC transporter permease [Agathobacter rectalis]RHO76004.1 ABC transporter permease [Ruminococcus sp. AF45-4BH]RGK45294.1 ABC transporter permease [Dorea formicigenerans]RGT08684.1 ABC transporter permease [Dorea formicigenerans]RHE29461.1 ABC transporter permease [Dorea formicigenerans]
MKMTTRVAYCNMRHYKSKNILIGIAIILTTLLLFVIPSIGKDMVEVNFAVINKIYPTWHALYRNVDESTVMKLAAHHDVKTYGLRSDAGYMNLEDATVSMMYMDRTGMELYKVKLKEGQLPQKENDIVVSKGILEALGQNGKIGDTITVPYQILKDDGLDYTKEKDFRICGFLADNENSKEQKQYTSLVSEAFLKAEIPVEQVKYRFLLQVNGQKGNTTADYTETIQNIARQFGISEDDMNINKEYLAANYVDPATIPVIVGIMLIVVLAGIITIYSVYYVSMNQRVREFGKLKAIGATKRQLRQIVLREGMGVALFAIPIGLLIGTVAVKVVLLQFVEHAKDSNVLITEAYKVVAKGEVQLYYWWIYLLAIAVTLCTVYLSLMKPMRMAAKVSEIEAMRYQGGSKRQKSSRKGYQFLNIGRLTKRNLAENKKKSTITIVSMAVTGIFVMMVATVLSCANPMESAKSSIVGQYEISPIVESGNKEHPEYEWAEVQKNNPLNEGLKQQIEELDGVERVDVFTALKVSGGPFEEKIGTEFINGVPEEYAEELKKGITEGNVTYEELKSGDKVILDRALLHWYPDIKVGDKLKLNIHDGDNTFQKEIEVAAIGEYGTGLTNYNCLIMAKEGAEKLTINNSSSYFQVIADKDYDEALEASLQAIVDGSGRLQMRTWKNEYDTWENAIQMTRGACYAFIIILAAISIMNLINTMINSVHVRKKELGMMQAIGMSDRQLMKMLQLEGIFYTVGTLIISIGVGSLAGYPLFLYAKRTGMFDISTYHYPVTAAIIIILTLFVIQMLLAIFIAKSVRKDSLIERIRFSE